MRVWWRNSVEGKGKFLWRALIFTPIPKTPRERGEEEWGLSLEEVRSIPNTQNLARASQRREEIISGRSKKLSQYPKHRASEMKKRGDYLWEK